MPKKVTTETAKKVAKKDAVKKTVAKKAAVKKTAVKKAAKKAVKKVAKKAVKKAVAEKAAVKKTVARKAVKKAAKPAKKSPVKKAPIVTTVIAKVDAGFGNAVYIRGNSSGLTWDAGVAMENKSSDEWVWTSTSVTSELEFKVLLNDTDWSTGPNGVVFPGATVVFEPSF